jgi:hypothetical protein
MGEFKLLKGYGLLIITSQLSPEFTIRLDVLPDDMLKVQTKYTFTPYDSMESEKIIKMKMRFSQYITFYRFISDNYFIIESLNNNITDTFNRILNNFDE